MMASLDPSKVLTAANNRCDDIYMYIELHNLMASLDPSKVLIAANNRDMLWGMLYDYMFIL